MEVIDRYSREDAIGDGMLVDISEEPETKEAGFRVPICLTASVYGYVTVPEKLEGSQDFKSRLWDTVRMAAASSRKMKATGATERGMRIVTFRVIYQMEKGVEGDSRPIEVELWLVFNASEGFTIMLPSDY